MKAMIKHELRLSAKLLSIWMGITLVLCLFAYFEYLSLQDSLEELAELVNSFPRILTVMFGISEGVDTAIGWYGCIYFWTSLLTNSYAVYLGVSVIAKEKEQGTFEYLFTKPVSRRRIVLAKAASGACCLFILAAFTGLCAYLTAVHPFGGLEQKGAVKATAAGLFLTEIILFSLALFLSSLAKTYRGAVRIGAGVLVISYGLYTAAGYSELPAFYYLTPLKYFDVYTVAKDGLELPFILITAVFAVFSVIISEEIWMDRELR